MKLLQQGIGEADDKALLHIKDALSRIIVEMVKREWPQQWPTLLSELSNASEKGLSQTELVSMVFLRLVEDVALLQTIESNQRRKDIYQALTVNMSEIFDFFLNLIERNIREYVTNQNAGNARVVQVILNTLSGFVEWVSVTHLVASNGRLLQMICYLLEFPDFQVSAVECLSQITNRKGIAKERKPLLFLFNDEPMGHIYRSLESMAKTQTEAFHQYLKKLTLAMQGLASQLTALWGKESDVQTPPRNFVIFLQIIVAFVRHPSISVTHGGVLVWLQLIKHDGIAKDSIFLDSIGAIIDIIGPKILKRPYPRVREYFTPNTIPYTTDAYICLDFVDGDEEYLQFVSRARVDFLEIFRQATLVSPLLTFSYCERWLIHRMEKSNTETITTCSITDPIYLEWEAIVAVLDGVLSRILLVTERPSIMNGLILLQKCLQVNTQDPLIYSVVLSCISSLFVFLSMSAAGNVAVNGVQLLPPVLEKIFGAIVFKYPLENSHSIISAAVKNLRRHASSCIVKIALKYPLLLMPIFEQINTTVKALCASTDQQLSNMEKLLLQEALLIISNHFCEFERQQLFIGEIIRPAVRSWQDLSIVLKSPIVLIEYVGLSKKPIESTADGIEDISYKNRSALLMALNTVLGVIKRCQCPDDPDKSYRGGFIVSTTENGNPITRNPAAAHVIPLLQHILALLRCLNELWNPSSIALIHENFLGANQMLENEKKGILGVVYQIPDPLDPAQLMKKRTPFDYMQKFLTALFDNSYHLMGAAGNSLGRDLYGLDGLASALINSVFSNLEHVPDFKMRTIVRVFLRPFVYSCPTTYHASVLVPIFGHFSPFSKFTSSMMFK